MALLRTSGERNGAAHHLHAEIVSSNASTRISACPQAGDKKRKSWPDDYVRVQSCHLRDAASRHTTTAGSSNGGNRPWAHRTRIILLLRGKRGSEAAAQKCRCLAATGHGAQ
jgi:hypothetical protein